MKRPLIYSIPVIIFSIVTVFFIYGLQNDPSIIKTVLVNRPVPTFSLPSLDEEKSSLTSDDLKKGVSLVNIFGSWCIACQVEHPVLMQIQKEGKVPLYGLDWRDTKEAATAWLQRHGNPYTAIGFDPRGDVAIDFGVTGAPETFIVDAQGIIRYKHIGPITPDIWNTVFLPIINEISQ